MGKTHGTSEFGYHNRQAERRVVFTDDILEVLDVHCVVMHVGDIPRIFTLLPRAGITGTDRVGEFLMIEFSLL